jgi:hypothetical protein
MIRRDRVGIAILALGMVLSAMSALAPAQNQPTHGPAADGSPAWFLQASSPSPEGQTIVAPGGHITVIPPSRGGFTLAACGDQAAQLCKGQRGFQAQECLMQNAAKLTGQCKFEVDRMSAEFVASGSVPPCSHSPVCDNRITNGIGPRDRQQLQRVEWEQTMGYTFSYPYDVPEGPGGIPSVALDSKNDLWVFKRSPVGVAQLYEFGPDHKLIRTLGPDVIPHAYKAHGMAIDSHDNVWLCYANLSIVVEVSPEGKLLKMIGEKGHRGDWIESKGQRLLWQPLMIAFAPDGDMYIGEGHANESPNDTDSSDPTDVSGAARIIHLDKNGNYINQWYGDNVGQGKFSMAHGLAVDPTNGNVWIGDREEYRIVIYTANGQFVKTLQMRNLVCALNFDREGNPWMASGNDGQFLKLNRDGKVLGAIGNGMGIGYGQFTEASYWSFDEHDNLYAGATGAGRVTVMLVPKGTSEHAAIF